jgi:hypothetical protein
MKLLVKEENFTISANIDERIKTSKSRLVVKQSPYSFSRVLPKNKNRAIIKDSSWTIRPKIGGVVLNQKLSNRVYKTADTDGIVINPRKNSIVLKASTSNSISIQKQTATAVYKQLRVVDLYVPDVVPNAVTWISDYEDLYDGTEDTQGFMFYGFNNGVTGFSFQSSTETINGINTPIQLEISWTTNYSYKDNTTYSTIDSNVQWKVWKGTQIDAFQNSTPLPEGSPVTITVANGDWITFTGNAIGPVAITQPQIRAYTITNKSNGNSVLGSFTIGTFYTD